MRNSLAFIFLLGLVAACTSQEGNTMISGNLNATVECAREGDCFKIESNQGQVPVVVKISNDSNDSVEFPVGSFERLFLYASYENSLNGMKYTVPSPPQDFSGAHVGTEISAGDHVILNDVIYPEYMEEVVDRAGPKTQKIIARFSVPNIPGWEQFRGMTAQIDVFYTRK